MLMNVYSDDVRTPLWNSLKFTERFRSRASINSQFILEQGIIQKSKKLFLNIKEGHHSGPSSQREHNYENALNISFLEFVFDNSLEIEKSFKLNLSVN